MLSSSDIANLMEQAQKLKATFDKFAVKLADEGMIDRNKFPWMSSIGDDSTRVTVSRLPSVNLCKSEVKEGPIECMVQNRDTTIIAHHIVDEMLDSNYGFNLVSTVGNDPISAHTSLNVCSHLASHEISEINQIDSITSPIGISLLKNEDGETKKYGNSELQVDVKYLKSDYCLVDKAHEIIERTTGCKLVKETHLLNACKVLDKMRLPDFIMEMAEVIKIEEDNSIECENMPILDVVYDDQDDTLLYDRRMFARLGALDGSYFNYVVTVGASKARFYALSGLLFDGCQSSSQFICNDELFDGKLDYECPRFQDLKWFMGNLNVELHWWETLKNIPPLYLSQNNVAYWLVSDFKVHNNADIFPANGSFKYFDPGVCVSLFYTLTLEGKADFWGEKNIVCVESTWALFNSLLLWSKCIYSNLDTSSFLTYTFNPGEASFKEVPELPKGCDETLLSSFKCTGTVCHIGEATQVKVFDPGLMYADIVVYHPRGDWCLWVVQWNTWYTTSFYCIFFGFTWLVDLAPHSNIWKPISIGWLPFMLQLNVDFPLCKFGIPSRGCDVLITIGNSFTFDPDELNYSWVLNPKFLKAASSPSKLYNLKQVKLLQRFESTDGQRHLDVTIWVFDPGGNDTFLGSMGANFELSDIDAF